MQDLLKTVLRPAPCRAHSLHLTVSFYGIFEVDPPVPPDRFPGRRSSRQFCSGAKGRWFNSSPRKQNLTNSAGNCPAWILVNLSVSGCVRTLNYGPLQGAGWGEVVNGAECRAR